MPTREQILKKAIKEAKNGTDNQFEALQRQVDVIVAHLTKPPKRR